MDINILELALIFGARVLDVSCGTFRILLLVRGKKLTASLLGFVEVGLYMTILAIVLGGKSLEIPQLIAYCAGFATGNYVGIFLEERLLRRFVLLEIIADVSEESYALIRRLREEGFGTTVLIGQGKGGVRHIIKVICPAREVGAVQALIGPKFFCFISDVKGVWGGYFRMKRR